jgi:signal peptidase I
MSEHPDEPESQPIPELCGPASVDDAESVHPAAGTDPTSDGETGAEAPAPPTVAVPDPQPAVEGTTPSGLPADHAPAHGAPAEQLAASPSSAESDAVPPAAPPAEPDGEGLEPGLLVPERGMTAQVDVPPSPMGPTGPTGPIVEALAAAAGEAGEPTTADAPTGLPAAAATDRSLSPLERLRGLQGSAPGSEPSRPRGAGVPRPPQPPRPLAPQPVAPTPAVIAVGDRPRPYDAETPAPAAVVTSADTEAKPPKRQGSFLRELPILLVIAIVLALLIKTFLVQAFFIPSGSMEQTLHIHDRVLVNKLAFHTGSPQLGEIVVFNTAGTRFADPSSGDYVACPKSNPIVTGVRALQRFVGVGTCGQDDFIKRIIAGPGDTIKCCNEQNQLLLNGKALVEPYLYQDNASAFCEASEEQAAQPEGSYDPSLCTGSSPPVTVPAGMYWVMGDHRMDSADSRYYGFVPADKLVGRAFIRIWPPSRIGFLHIPGTFKGAAATATAVAATPVLAAPALAVPLVGGGLLRRRRRHRRSARVRS